MQHPHRAPGGLYHVVARGNRWERIYHDDDDRRFFLVAVGEACERTGWRVHVGGKLTMRSAANVSQQISRRPETDRTLPKELQTWTSCQELSPDP